MNKTALVATVAGAMLGGTAVYTVTAQEHDHGDHQMSPEDMMQMYLESGKPGPEHAEMAKGVGTFTAHGTMYMPDGSSSTWEGTVERNAMWDGRFILEHYEVEDMMPGVDMFEGYGVVGFDKARGVYQSTWIDSISTAVLISEGKMKSGSNEIVMWGSRMNPMTKEEEKIKSVITINDDGSYIYDMYVMMPQGEFKEMSIHHSPTGEHDDHSEHSGH